MRWLAGFSLVATALACSSEECEPACKADEACSHGTCWGPCDSDLDCPEESICVDGHCADGNRLPSVHCLPAYSGGVAGNCPFGGGRPSKIPAVTIKDLADVEQLDLREQVEVTGDLVVSWTYMSSLKGLECITEVQGNVLVENNPCLTSLAGLSDITLVSGDLNIDRNVELATIGMSDLATVVGTLEITNNPKLPQAAAELFAAGVTTGATVVGSNGP